MYATEKLSAIEGVRIIGTAKKKSSVISFIMGNVHAHDVGTIVDREGIAVGRDIIARSRSCSEFGIPATARASFAFYNTMEEIDALAGALLKVKEIFGT